MCSLKHKHVRKNVNSHIVICNPMVTVYNNNQMVTNRQGTCGNQLER